MNEPITHGGIDARYKLCKCSECGVVRECTPAFDFYVRTGQPENGPLVCERCLILGHKDPPTDQVSMSC